MEALFSAKSCFPPSRVHGTINTDGNKQIYDISALLILNNLSWTFMNVQFRLLLSLQLVKNPSEGFKFCSRQVIRFDWEKLIMNMTLA